MEKKVIEYKYCMFGYPQFVYLFQAHLVEYILLSLGQKRKMRRAHSDMCLSGLS